ncbi:prepilin peptidase [Mesorhizobium sp. CN2-181]|uniref:A24 family peptidase n=1 Tax=Mesorhizobium yinganensis TaxID=3157707 RepID=UPI0032B7C668
MLEALIFVVFPFCMAFAAISDMLSMTIANRVAIILVVTFTVAAPLTGMEWTAFAWHFAAFFTVLLVTFSLFALGGMGGGDAKLLAATALYMGMSIQLVQYLVISAFLGGLLTLAILSFRGSALSVYAGHNLFLRNFTEAQKGIPYGIALGAGGLLTYPASPLMQWAFGQLAGN